VKNKRGHLSYETASTKINMAGMLPSGHNISEINSIQKTELTFHVIYPVRV
jgi:hypothetical protein